MKREFRKERGWTHAIKERGWENRQKAGGGETGKNNRRKKSEKSLDKERMKRDRVGGEREKINYKKKGRGIENNKNYQ